LRISIRYKIILLFLTIIAILLLGIYLYLDLNLKKYTFERIKTNLLKETRLAKSFIDKELKTQPLSYEFDRMADDIGSSLELRATLINPEGVVLGDSELNEKGLKHLENHLYRPEVQGALKSDVGTSVRFSTTIKTDMLYLAMPIGDKDVEGVIRLAVPLSEVGVISSRLKKILIIAVLFAFAMAIIAGFIGSSFISKPIGDIIKATADITKGDFTRKINVSTKDELEDLAKAFDYMAEEIQKRIEEVISNKSQLEAVLLSMFDGVMVLGNNSKILLVNKSLKEALGIADIHFGQGPLEAVRNVEINEITEQVLKTNKGVISKEITLLLPNERTMMVHATPVAKGKKIEGAVLVFHDITELRRLEKIRQDFIANVSHELRTPISNIKGYAETLIDGAIDDKDNARDFLKIIYTDAERLSNLVNDILDLSKIESGKLRLNITPCHIKSLVHNTIKAFKKKIDKKHIFCKIEIPENLPEITVDQSMIMQVFFNLIDNAIKYTPEKGTITIDASEISGNFIDVSIKDTGIGISEKDLPRIFERFYRVDKARSREFGGTGLGLSIVKHIVQSHGGKISVQSTEGRGSTFSFTVPTNSTPRVAA